MFNPGRLSLVLAWSPVVSSGFISAATLFTGPDAPVVDLGYARYRGKQDNLTHTSNYLGVPYAKASRFDHAQVSTKTSGFVAWLQISQHALVAVRSSHGKRHLSVRVLTS
jgi:hypothetical protein